MLVFEERGKPEYPEENLSEQRREPTTNKLNPHMASTAGFEPGPHWWEASALTTAPSLAGEGYVVLLFEFFEIFLVCVVDIRTFLLGM